MSRVLVLIALVQGLSQKQRPLMQQYCELVDWQGPKMPSAERRQRLGNSFKRLERSVMQSYRASNITAFRRKSMCLGNRPASKLAALHIFHVQDFRMAQTTPALTSWVRYAHPFDIFRSLPSFAFDGRRSPYFAEFFAGSAIRGLTPQNNPAKNPATLEEHGKDGQISILLGKEMWPKMPETCIFESHLASQAKPPY